MWQTDITMLLITTIAIVTMLIVPGIAYAQLVSGNTSSSGWVSLTSDPPGASVYVDNQPLMGSDGKQLVTPCTAYIDSGSHIIKLSMDGYADKVGTIDMVSNTQHDPVFMSLDRPVMPPIGTLIVVVAISLLAVVLIVGIVLGLILRRMKK